LGGKVQEMVWEKTARKGETKKKGGGAEESLRQRKTPDSVSLATFS